MPFPVEEIYIEETENVMSVKFPPDFKSRMLKSNGGELVTDDFAFELHPFFDKSDTKRISRTCNHIALETENAREWLGFPKDGVAIGSDAYGNIILLKHRGDGILCDEIHFWNHETGETFKIAETILALDMS